MAEVREITSSRDARERNDVFDHAVAEIGIRVAAALGAEWQDGDGGDFCALLDATTRRCRAAATRAGDGQRIGANRPRDVFQAQLAEVLGRSINSRGHPFEHGLGNDNTAGRRILFQARRDIDAAPVDVFRLDNDLTDVQSDAEMNSPILGLRTFAFGNFR